MKIALDISPLTKKHGLAHRVRGTGFYTQHLKDALVKYFPKNEYVFFARGEKLPDDVDIIHYPYFEPFFLTLPIYKNHKVVVTVHDLTPLVFPKEFPSGIRGRIKWAIQKNSLRNVDGIIADSESSKRDINQYAGISTDKIWSVYLAAGEGFKRVLDTHKIKEVKEKHHLPNQFILYVGDATWNKNLPRLIDSVANISVPLVLVGKALIENKVDTSNAWNKDLVSVQEKATKSKNIIRLGFVSDEDLVTLYSCATVSVMPSLYEGFGLPVLEAMQCGSPVITSRAGSLNEVAGEAAFYTDPNSTESITEGIKTMLEDKKLRDSFVERGFIQAKKFTWQKTADETMKIYEKIVGS